MADPFDLIVIGAGSGGVAAARRAALHGARVAIIEQGRVGGTCVLRGCVPKKLLMYAAQYADAFTEAQDFGWSTTQPVFSMAHWAHAKAVETQHLEGRYRQLLSDSSVQLIAGRARLLGAGKVAVADSELQATHILIATGASPVRDLIAGAETCPSSDQLLDLDYLPKHMTILGAGYIAVEFASMFARLGSQVRLCFRGELPLRGFDADLRQRVAKSLHQHGVELQPHGLPQRLEAEGAGWRLHCADYSQSTDYVLSALGRRPNTRGLGLESVGIVLDQAGAIPIDHQLQTQAEGIYAIGDVTHRKNLTPVAIAEGRWLAERLFAGSRQAAPNLDQVATAVFTLPPAASIGLTEAEAPVGTEVYETEFKPMRLVFGRSEERTYLKLLSEPNGGRVIGIHMHGQDAAEIIQSLAVAVTAGLAKTDFDRTMALHPSTAEEFVLLGRPSRVVTPAT